MNIEETNTLVEEVKAVFGDGYEVVACIGAKDTEYAYNFISVSQIWPWCCVFTMNSTEAWTAFQRAARVFVAKEQEKEQEKALEEQARQECDGEGGWTVGECPHHNIRYCTKCGRCHKCEQEQQEIIDQAQDKAENHQTYIDLNPLEEIDPFLDGPDLNETVHPVVETNPWSLTNPNGYWHD